MPCSIAHKPDDRLNDEPGNGGGQPQNGYFFGPSSESFENPADVGILQRKSELNSEKAETQVPDLPKAQAGLGLREGVIH
jgi:hypothetical protein